MDKNLSIAVKILISEQITRAAGYYFKQIFVLCRLNSKNVLQLYLLIICKEHTKDKTYNPFSRNNPTLFQIKKRNVGRFPMLKSYFIKLKKAGTGGIL